MNLEVVIQSSVRNSFVISQSPTIRLLLLSFNEYKIINESTNIIEWNRAETFACVKFKCGTRCYVNSRQLNLN